jgi:hypothetical protein
MFIGCSERREQERRSIYVGRKAWAAELAHVWHGSPLLAGIADRESEESLAGFDLGRISPELRPLAARLLVAGHRERQVIGDEFRVRNFV